MDEIDILKIDTNKFVADLTTKYRYLEGIDDLGNLQNEIETILKVELDLAIKQLSESNPEKNLHYVNRLKALRNGFYSVDEIDQFKKNYDFDRLTNDQINTLKDRVSKVNDIEHHQYLWKYFNRSKPTSTAYSESVEGLITKTISDIKAVFKKQETINAISPIISSDILKKELVQGIEKRNLYHQDLWFKEVKDFNADPKTFFKIKLKGYNPEVFPLYKSVVKGDFIPDLHEKNDLAPLIGCISTIQLYQYITELLDNPIRLQEFKNKKEITPFKPIVWNSGKEALGTLFADLKHNNIISGTAQEIQDFIKLNFVDADGDSFKQATLEDNFRKSPKKKTQKDGTTKLEITWDEKVRKLAHELMQHLKTQKPKKKK